MPELAERYVEELADVVGRLTRLSHVATREDAVCCGVTVSQCHILLGLLEAGEATMQALSHRLGIAPSTLTRTIEPLVTGGWVRRARGDSDRRKVVVRLSPEGRDKAADLKAVQLESCRRLLESLPVSERETVVAAMRTFMTALDRAMHGQCCPEMVETLARANEDGSGGEPHD